MDNNIMTLLAFIGALLPIIGVVLKLNSTITELNTTMKCVQQQIVESKEDRSEIRETVNNHETRITVLEKDNELKKYI